MKEDALNDLFYEIQDVRKEMIHVANEYGYTHEKTIMLSQKLDDIMNDYQQQMTESTREFVVYEKLARKYGKVIKRSLQLQILNVIFIFTNCVSIIEW